MCPITYDECGMQKFSDLFAEEASVKANAIIRCFRGTYAHLHNLKHKAVFEGEL